MEPQNVSKIVSDAIKEIQLGDVRKGESVLQLLTQAPNTYHTALQAFRPSLKSEYEDVRSIAACAVGRFGRGVDWVLPALEDGFRQDQDNIMAVCAFAHAIAELKTSDAAQVLVKLAGEQFLREGGKTTASFTFAALEKMGELAVGQLSRLSQMIEQAEDKKSHLPYEVMSLRSSIAQQTSTSYFGFKNDGYGSVDGRIKLGRDPFTMELPLLIGKSQVIFDQRVEFTLERTAYQEDFSRDDGIPERQLKLNSQSYEVRCVIIERKPEKFVCIAVWDHFSSSSLMNKFESFAQGVVDSLNLTSGVTGELEFGIYVPFTDRDLAGNYTGVLVSLRDGELEVTKWLPNSHLETVLNGDAAYLRRYLQSTLPALPVGFIEYLEAQVYDNLIRDRYLNKVANSSDGRLDYTAMPWPLSGDLKQIERSGSSPNTCPTILGDSFDPPGNEEFLGSVLPQELREMLIQCKTEHEIISEDQSAYDVSFLPAIDSLRNEQISSQPGAHEIAPYERKITLTLDPLKYGVLLFKGVDEEGVEVRVTNIPHTVFSGSTGFTWGYAGSGPSELAINILNLFVPPGSDGHPERECQTTYWAPKKKTFTSETALKLADDFDREFVRVIPPYGGFISVKRVKSWILERVAKDLR